MEVDIRARSCRRSNTLTRTFSIADTLDAITRHRPYGKAQSLDAAREKIRTLFRTQFDPESVGVFFRMSERHGGRPAP